MAAEAEARFAGIPSELVDILRLSGGTRYPSEPFMAHLRSAFRAPTRIDTYGGKLVSGLLQGSGVIQAIVEAGRSTGISEATLAANAAVRGFRQKHHGLVPGAEWNVPGTHVFSANVRHGLSPETWREQAGRLLALAALPGVDILVLDDDQEVPEASTTLVYHEGQARPTAYVDEYEVMYSPGGLMAGLGRASESFGEATEPWVGNAVSQHRTLAHLSAGTDASLEWLTQEAA